MCHRPNFAIILLTCLILAACSGFGESARLRRQAKQFMEDGRLPEAVLTYRQALLSYPDDPDLLSGLGLALAAQGRSRLAAGVLIRAAALKPGEASIKNALAKLVTQPQDGLDLTLAWISTTVGSEPVGAAAAAGRIFVVYADGRLTALDQVSGQTTWDIQAPAALVSPPAADAGQVWVGAGNGSVYVFDAGSGQSLGSYQTGGAVYAAPVLNGQVAYCASSVGTLYALDRTTLKVTWKAQTGGAMNASPVLSGTSVYVGSNDGRLYGLNASNGERFWPYGIPTQGAIESLPSLADGRIFFGSDDGRVYALDAETGGQYWRFSTPDAVYASPLVLNDQVIAASSGLELASLHYTDGAPSWSLPFDHPITAAPVFFKDRLYLVTVGDPRLFAVDVQTGKLLGELDTGDWTSQGPLLVGNDLILVGKDGAVFLYR
jgi:outer membrane protein assembly factor BamB